MTNQLVYGQDDGTFLSVGGEKGVRRLVDRFYDLMRDNPEYHRIWNWHPQDKEMSRDKLARFLTGWMGGPKLYQEKYGGINLPTVHAHLDVTEKEMDMWLDCMRDALVSLDYPDDLTTYLVQQLSVPANRIRQVCSR